MQKKAGFYTLGCKLNFSETSTIAREFESAGIVRAARGESADIYVINTCSVTEHADKKCRNTIRKIVRENPSAIIAVTGCYAQLKPADLAAIEGVDLVIGNNDKGTLTEKVRALSGKAQTSIYTCDTEELTSFFASFSSSDRTRSFLKVQDGCDYKCSYCTIPLARGASRNISIAKIVEEAEKIAAKSQKEIVLTGINTGDFGKTTGERFIDLLAALDGVEGIERYRISSIEPNLLSDEVIDFCAKSTKFQPHFHIPLQSGSDKILAAMRRRYTTTIFRERIEAVRRAIPQPFIGIDVIVGFPGESDDDFETTYKFLESITPSFLHIFPYSVRANTPAAEFDSKVSPEVSQARVARLGELSESLHTAFLEKLIGTRAKVLFESTKKGGLMFGYTENYAKVEAPYRKDCIGQVIEVEIDGFAESGNLSGRI